MDFKGVDVMTKRNPCRYQIEKLNPNGYIVKEWTRGYVQDRNNKEQMYLISNGVGDIDERWVDYKDVKLTKARWTNRSSKVISKKSFWTRAK